MIASGNRAQLWALGLAALALRPQLVGIGPLVPEIQNDLSTSHAVTGLLATIPVACMGLFALPAARLAARHGTRTAVGACLALIAVGGLGRSFAPSALLLLALTLPVGIGMGAAQAMLPIAVKERMAGRPGLGTGAYSTGVQVGAVGSSIAVIGLAAVGSWRLALGVLSVAALLSCIAWLLLDTEVGARRTRAPSVAELGAVAREPVTWVLVVCFGLMGMVYYGLISWMPDAYQERGWTEATAGGLVVALSGMQVPGALLGAWAGDRIDRRTLLLASAGVLAVGTLGLAVLPVGAYAWAVLAGLGMGIIFTVTLTMPLEYGAHATEAGAIAGVMLTGGYVAAALAPVVLGAVRDATGSFGAVLDSTAGLAVVLLVVSLLIPRRAQIAVPA